jgi:hypothetical protein
MQKTKKSKFLQKFIWKYAEILKIDSEISNKLWRIEEKSNIFKEIISIGENVSIGILCTIESCIGSNWNEKFNKIGAKLITDDEIIQIINEQNIEESSRYRDDHNLLKLCDIVEKNFDTNKKEMFYGNLMQNTVAKHQTVQNEIVSRYEKLNNT